MATANDDFDSIVGDDLDQALGDALVDEVHDVLTEVLRLTAKWFGERKPPVHPSSRPHPVLFIAEIPDEILVLAHGEVSAIYGDATRRTRQDEGADLVSSSNQRTLAGHAAKMLSTEIVQRLEKR